MTMRTLLALGLASVLALARARSAAAEVDPLVVRIDRALGAETPPDEREAILEKIDALPFERVAKSLAEARFSRARLERVSRHEILLPRGLGGRAYDLLVPESYDPATRHPVLVAQHGAGGASGDEIRRWRDLASKRGWRSSPRTRPRSPPDGPRRTPIGRFLSPPSTTPAGGWRSTRPGSC